MLPSIKQQRDLQTMWELCNSGWTPLPGTGRAKDKTVQDKAELNKSVCDGMTSVSASVKESGFLGCFFSQMIGGAKQICSWLLSTEADLMLVNNKHPVV